MIDDVKIGRVLGTGAYGKVYLCTYKGKKYAMKIQNLTGMMNEETKYSSDIWREIDLYRYIDKMPAPDQVFFNRMYEYKVYNETVKIGTNIGDSKRKWDRNIKNINNSGWRVKYLLEYKGNVNIYDFLYKFRSRLTPPQIYSLCLQILYIFSILKKGGYVHNDMHLENILVVKTNKDSFVFNRKIVNYYGIQLSVIDYGKAMNKKAPGKKDKYMFTEGKLMDNLYKVLDYILTDTYETVYFCEENDKNGLWNSPYTYETGLKKLFTNHLEFCNKTIRKYLKIYPKAKENIKILYSLYETDTNIRSALTNDTFYYDLIISRLDREFYIVYPVLYKEYFGWCRVIKTSLPKAECLEIYSFTDLKSIIKYFLNKV